MRRGNPFTVKRGPKGNKVTAAELRAVRELLKAANDRRECYFCKKQKTDTYAMMMVPAHEECVTKAEMGARESIGEMLKP